jgi:hypothetical protein
MRALRMTFLHGAAAGESLTVVMPVVALYELS